MEENNQNGYYQAPQGQPYQQPPQSEKPKKPITKKWWFWVLIVIVVIVIISALGGGNDDSNSSVQKTESISQSETQQGETTEEATSEETTASSKVEAGNAVSTKDLKISYLKCNANYTNYSEYETVKDGCKVIRAEFKFENLSTVDQFISGTECYADNVKCDTFLYAEDSSYAIDTISPGRSVSAIVYYEVPKDAKDIEIEFDGDFWSNEKIVFVVK